MFGLFKSRYQKYTDAICKNAGHKDLHSLLTELYNDEFAWDQAMYGASKFVESTNMWEALGEDKTNAKRCLRDPDGQVEALRKIFADYVTSAAARWSSTINDPDPNERGRQGCMALGIMLWAWLSINGREFHPALQYLADKIDEDYFDLAA